MVLQDRFRVSQRRACRLAGQNRNTQRRPTPIADIEDGTYQESCPLGVLELSTKLQGTAR